MAISKLSLKIKAHNGPDAIVGVWLAKKDMEQMGVEVNDFVYASIGWSGSKSCRAKVLGTLPDDEAGYIGMTDDRLYEGNMKEGEICKVWKHTIWY